MGDVGQYRVGALLSNRFFGDRLGVMTGGSFFRANRDSEQLDAAYEDELLVDPANPDAPPDLEAREVVAGVRNETRDRYSLNADLDLDLGRAGTLFYNTVYARTTRDETRFRLEATKSLNSVQDDVRLTDREIDLVTNNLRGRHLLFGRAELEWQGSHAAAVNHTPRELVAVFNEGGGFDTAQLRVADSTRNPYDVLRAVANDYRNKGLSNLLRSEQRILERDLVAQADLKVPYRAGWVSGFVKTGAKVRDKYRRRSGSRAGNFANDLTRAVVSVRPDAYTFSPFGVIGINNFRGCTGEGEQRVCDEGEADFREPGVPGPLLLDTDGIEALWDALVESDEVLPVSSFGARSYEVEERVSAGYVMAELNLGPRVMLLPGVRYEHTAGDYVGTLVSNGSSVPGTGAAFADSSTVRDEGVWLPMVHLRLRPTASFDVRFAATRALSRPNFYNLVPYQFIGSELRRGNSALEQARAWNYDLFLTFYTSRYGLVSVGGFYKTIENIEYVRTGTLFDPASPYNFFTVTEPVNAEEDTQVYGFEVDVQTAFRYLPAPFDGLVLTANYARIFSETVYPFFNVVTDEDGIPVIDAGTGLPIPFYGERTGPAPGQSDHIANASLGYERGGFSGRVSLTYQSAYLDAVASNEARDAYTDDFTRWDVAMRQRVGSGFSVLLNLVNITSLPERSFTGLRGRPSNEEYFGWTAELGLRYDL